MKKFKGIVIRQVIAITALALMFVPVFFVDADEGGQPAPELYAGTPVIIEVFEREDCGHCQDLFAYLEELTLQRSDFEIVDYDIYTLEGKEFFATVTEDLKLVKGTPIIYLNESIIQGFDSADTTGKKIEAYIDAAKEKESLMTLHEFIEIKGPEDIIAGDEGVCDEESCDLGGELMVTIPFTNITLNVAQYSLPVMSAILGVIDGFNPCAMWVLVMFLTALVAIGDKKKMWQIAGLFILAEAVMYYLILTVWLYAWDFIGLDKFVTPVVGVIAIGGGIFFLWEYWSSRKDEGDACKVTNLEQKAKISKKIKDFVSKPLNLAVALGIIGLALSVNVIEFACSIGIPQAFTKILDINALSWLSKQIYNFIYIIGYMLDDFIVFGIALYSFDKIGLTTKYAKLSNIFGGILMIVLGIILIFFPQLLVL